MLKSVFLRTSLFFTLQLALRVLLLLLRTRNDDNPFSLVLLDYFREEMDWIGLVLSSLLFAAFWWWLIRKKMNKEGEIRK